MVWRLRESSGKRGNIENSCDRENAKGLEGTHGDSRGQVFCITRASFLERCNRSAAWRKRAKLVSMMLAKDILKEALQLDPRDRVDLVEELSASLDPSDLGPEWETEIRARIEDVDSGRVKSVPAAEVFARLEAKFGAK